MSTKEINIKTAIAVLLLIVDVLAIRWSVDAKTENEMHHHMNIVSHYSGIQLTLNKNITETFRGKTVTVPAGTVVTTIGVSADKVYFSYSDASIYRAYEDFEEQDQLEKIKQEHEEVEKKNNAERQRIINEYKGPKISMMLCGLLLGSLITFILVKIKWYAILYVIDVVFVFLLFNVNSLIIVSLKEAELMDYDNREKNPIFFPALIAALLLPAGVLFGDFGLWMLVTPFVALILSLVGLVISKKLQARFAGCVFCLVLSILELCFVAYMSKPVSVPPAYTIQPHSLSPEESASIESVHEEINHALNEKPARRNEK